MDEPGFKRLEFKIGFVGISYIATVPPRWYGTVYPKKYAHGFVVLCFVVVMQSFIMNSHEVFIHIHQGCFAGTGAIVRLPQCQWSKPDGYGKISQCITTTKHNKAKTACIFLGIYCMVYTSICKPHISGPHYAIRRLTAKSCECYNDRIGLQFDRLLGSAAVDMSVKFQSDWKSLNSNLAASRLHEILR